MSAVIILALGLGAIVGFSLLIACIRRWPVLGFVSAVGYLLIAWEYTAPPPLVNVGGTSVYLLDVISGALLLIGLMNWRQLGENIGGLRLVWVGLGALLLIALIRGLTQFDVGPTVNEFRAYLPAYAALTWSMSLKWDEKLRDQTLIKAFGVLGFGLLGVALYHIAVYGLGSASEFVDAGTGVEQTSRPLTSVQAFALLTSAGVFLARWGKSRKTFFLVSALVFLLLIVVVQQRTVWVAAIAIGVVVFLLGKSETRVSILVLGFLAALAITFVLATSSATSIVDEIIAAANSSGTYDGRVYSWLDLLGRSFAKGPLDVIFGSSFGSGFGRFEGPDRYVEFAPHNWYLSIYLRAGAIGFALFSIFVLTSLGRALRRPADTLKVALIVAMMVYAWTYSWPWYICIFIGWVFIRRETPTLPDLEERVVSNEVGSLGRPR